MSDVTLRGFLPHELPLGLDALALYEERFPGTSLGMRSAAMFDDWRESHGLRIACYRLKGGGRLAVVLAKTKHDR